MVQEGSGNAVPVLPSCNCAVSAVNRDDIQVKLKGHKIKKRRAKEGSLGVYCRHDLRFLHRRICSHF